MEILSLNLLRRDAWRGQRLAELANGGIGCWALHPNKSAPKSFLAVQAAGHQAFKASRLQVVGPSRSFACGLLSLLILWWATIALELIQYIKGGLNITLKCVEWGMSQPYKEHMDQFSQQCGTSNMLPLMQREDI